MKYMLLLIFLIHMLCFSMDPLDRNHMLRQPVYTFYAEKSERRMHTDHPSAFLAYQVTDSKIIELMDQMNLDYPGLENVKAKYDAALYREALALLMDYYETRSSIKYFKDSWPVNRPEPDTEYDCTEADNTLIHDITFAGVTYNPGSPINWDYAKTEAQEWNAALNRLDGLYPLIHAWWHTHQSQYADYAVEDIADYVQTDSPASYSFLKVLNDSIRAVSMTDAWFYLQSTSTFSDDIKCLVLLELIDVEEYLMVNIPSGGWRSNWWYGSIILSRMFPEFQVSPALCSSAESIMADYAAYNYFEDGYAETSSLMYHIFVESSQYFYLADLYSINNWSFPDSTALTALFQSYGQLFEPDYNIPIFGEGEKRDPQIFRDLMLRAAVFLQDDQLLYLATQGEQGTLPDYTSVIAPYSRLAFLRKDWTPQSSFLAINAGYNGGWHSNYDCLSFIYYANQCEILRDSGTYNYEAPFKEAFQKSQMHNLPLMNGQGQEAGDDAYPPEIRGEILTSTFSDHADYLHAQYVYSWMSPAESFQRKFFYEKDHFLLVADSFASGNYPIEELFQIGSVFTPSGTGAEIMLNASGDADNARLIALKKPASVATYHGSEAPYIGWNSEVFNQIDPAYAVSFSYPAGSNNLLFLCLPDAQPVQYDLCEEEAQAQCWLLEIKNGSERFLILSNGEDNSLSLKGFSMQGTFCMIKLLSNTVQYVLADQPVYYLGLEVQGGSILPDCSADSYLFYH